MGKINVKDFADLFELSPIGLGLLFGQLGLSIDLVTETFEGQHLIDVLKNSAEKKIIKTVLKRKTGINSLENEVLYSNLRADVLPLFRSAGLDVEWCHSLSKRMNTTLRVVSTTGKSILIGVRSSNSSRTNPLFNFVVTTPYQPWYCLIMNSIETVHLRKKEDFLTLDHWSNTLKCSINTNLKHTAYLFKNQIEVFKEELESL